MAVTWLHVSDFHLRGGDSYDRDVVLKALVESVRRYRLEGRPLRIPDLIFATGDVAYSGKAAEYVLATKFFDDLLKAAKLEKCRLYVVPGNHDVDRDLGAGLARTLESCEEADKYFGPGIPKRHLTQKQQAFLEWHNRYFEGIRALPKDSTCGPVEVVDIGGVRIGILPINSALFSQDEHDHDKLWIGRRCLDHALETLAGHHARVKVALVHHPLEWLHSAERSNIKHKVRSEVNFILHGHLHEMVAEITASASDEALYLVAGAAYQGRKWPNRAAYATVEGDRLTVFPIRYEDQPREVWTVDPSVFPDEPHEGVFPIPGLVGTTMGPPAPLPRTLPGPAGLPRFRSNISSRLERPFVGREELMDEILTTLGEPSSERLLILHGLPGVGKSELAREFARRQRDRYPGGTFFVDAGAAAAPVDLALVGKNILNLDFSPDLSLPDQCSQTLHALGSAPTLLIYDNVRSAASVLKWLPPSGMACHVLLTTVVERWDPGWPCLEVKPLSPDASWELIEKVAGPSVAQRYGQVLIDLAGGLPVQLCPVAVALAYEDRRGRRLASTQLTLSREAAASFSGAYDHVESAARLLLHAAAFLNCQRIVREELSDPLRKTTGWSEDEFRRLLDACLDLHLLEGGAVLRMHQLLASFLLGTPLVEGAETLERVRLAQGRRLVELATALAVHPGDTELAARLLVFPVTPRRWAEMANGISIEDGEMIGRALREIGRFDEARPWYERAVEAKQQGDVHGRVDHKSVAGSLREGVRCLRRVGRLEQAKAWEEAASGLEQ